MSVHSSTRTSKVQLFLACKKARAAHTCSVTAARDEHHDQPETATVDDYSDGSEFDSDQERLGSTASDDESNATLSDLDPDEEDIDLSRTPSVGTETSVFTV